MEIGIVERFYCKLSDYAFLLLQDFLALGSRIEFYLVGDCYFLRSELLIEYPLLQLKVVFIFEIID